MLSENQKTNKRINLPSIELPKGGGTVKGADSNFHTDAFTGRAHFDRSIPLPQARLIPSLSLIYSSNSGNGLLGASFNLSIPSFSRNTSRGIPAYYDSKNEDIILYNGQELVFDKSINRYVERVHSSFPFTQTERDENGMIISCKIKTTDNQPYTFGVTKNLRIQDLQQKNNPFIDQWNKNVRERLILFRNIITRLADFFKISLIFYPLTKCNLILVLFFKSSKNNFYVNN